VPTHEISLALRYFGNENRPLMPVERVAPSLVGAQLARALHQDAGDNLKAIRDAMPELPRKKRLVLQHFVLEFFGSHRAPPVWAFYVSVDAAPWQ
jgi:hypothetical protein